MATINSIATRTGTGWVIDVTPCNLDADLNIKDFVVFHNNLFTSNVVYNKTTRTSLTYTGAALPANTSIEIRRKTPVSQKFPVLFATRFSSTQWNQEIDRNVRWKEEVDLNGAGTGVTAVIPRNDAFGVLWSGDTVYPPTRDSVYNRLVNTPQTNVATTFTAQLNSSSTLTYPDNTTRVATTQYLTANYLPSASPTLTSNPATNNNSLLIPSTSWVRSNIAPKAVTVNTSFTSGATLTSTFATLATITTVVPANVIAFRVYYNHSFFSSVATTTTMRFSATGANTIIANTTIPRCDFNTNVASVFIPTGQVFYSATALNAGSTTFTIDFNTTPSSVMTNFSSSSTITIEFITA